MTKVKVTCDSTCDLSRELIEKYDITVLPLYVTMGDKQYRDGADLQIPQLFDYVSASGQLPKTAAVSVDDYKNVFGSFVQQGYEVVHINISASMSACYQNACLAAEELSGVYPVDSKNLSTGSGHLALAAAELAAEGKGGKEIADILCERREKLEVSFVIDTLEYLRKGGRCSSVAALGANLLKLKPCIEVKDGAMGVGKKYRGKIDDCLIRYVEERLKGRNDVDTSRIFITHTLAAPETVDAVRSLVRECQPFDEVIETVAGCTVASHCGRGTLGILFFTK